MFFKLVSRNSKRSRRENGLFHASLLVVVIAFYVILALPKQDVIIFLKEMESDAIPENLSNGSDTVWRIVMHFVLSRIFFRTLPDGAEKT